MYCRFFDSCCEPNDLLRVFVETLMHIYFNHFPGNYYFTEPQINDHQYVMEFKEFLVQVALHLYLYLVPNSKKDPFEKLFQDFKSVVDYNLPSFKTFNTNYLQYLIFMDSKKDI